MPPNRKPDDEESQPLTEDSVTSPESLLSSPRTRRSSSSTSTTSLVFEHLASNGQDYTKKEKPYRDSEDEDTLPLFEEVGIDDGPAHSRTSVDPKYKRWLYIIGGLCAAGWIAALVLFVFSGYYRHRSSLPHDPDAVSSIGNGRKITIGQLQSGQWYPIPHSLSWIKGPNGEDGMLLERGGQGDRDYLVVEDVRKRNDESTEARDSITLMKEGSFKVGTALIHPTEVWPSPDLKWVMVLSDKEKNWRHSYTGHYWLFDIETQTGQPLDHADDGRIQLAKWSPNSDHVVFTRNNNIFIRKLDGDVTQVTKTGGPEMFNGVPDWVYEEEVFSGNSATWWSRDGAYVAFLATNESAVPTYPVQYFISRPSGKQPVPGLENYPEVRQIKYPKAGAPNPVVSLRFYDVSKDELFDVRVEDDFPDPDRLITEVVWGREGKVLIRQTNRESDILKMVLVDCVNRSGKIVRTRDVNKLDGGWFEVSETTTFVPRDPENGREVDGYIDTIIHDGYDHLAYFSPPDTDEPLLLTSGNWEVVEAPSSVDFKNNLVYFTGTKEGSTQRHIYKVDLKGKGLESITDTSKQGYYSASFSSGSGYALLSYKGPNIPWQKVISTPSNPTEYSDTIEENKGLAQMASRYELPIKKYSTVTVEGVQLNVVERLPPHFDERKRYPVLFFLYGGPGSQQVDRKFTVDFQSYVASNLGYIVVTVDGRGTGFLGRKARTIIRGNIGYYEAFDQIATAKEWAKKRYVDESRMAIWGWSYGGYMTLKTLEQDAGRTFRYGMAVAPVTDWAFYGKCMICDRSATDD